MSDKEKILEVIFYLGIFRVETKKHNVILFDQYDDMVAVLYFDEDGVYRGYDI
jgi:hypothetical protein